MNLVFHGAARCVTGSCHLLRLGSTRWLVDAGMFQGHDGETPDGEDPNAAIPFDVAGITGVLLTHAHIDHIGRLPRFVRAGLRCPIYATAATADLVRLLLTDSAHIQAMEAEWQSRRRIRRGEPPVEPLYTQSDVEETCRLLHPVDYGKPVQLSPDAEATWFDAGHILGSARILVDVKTSGGRLKLGFSGDVGRGGRPILRDPVPLPEADVLLLESTYGDRLHEDSVSAESVLVEVLEETYRTGGNVIVPAFAVGRIQELLFHLDRLVTARRLPHMPVYVDTPLGAEATDVFLNHPECYDEESLALLRAGDEPFLFRGLTFVRTADESRLLNNESRAVIIAASGMAEAGRIKHHLKHNLWRPESTVLFVGYQAAGTLGRSILDGARRVTIFGEEIAVKARVRSIPGFSAHADRDELLNWLDRVGGGSKQVVLTHGDESAMQALSQHVAQRGHRVFLPRLGESLQLGSGSDLR